MKHNSGVLAIYVAQKWEALLADTGRHDFVHFLRCLPKPRVVRLRQNYMEKISARPVIEENHNMNVQLTGDVHTPCDEAMDVMCSGVLNCETECEVVCEPHESTCVSDAVMDVEHPKRVSALVPINVVKLRHIVKTASRNGSNKEDQNRLGCIDASKNQCGDKNDRVICKDDNS